MYLFQQNIYKIIYKNIWRYCYCYRKLFCKYFALAPGKMLKLQNCRFLPNLISRFYESCQCLTSMQECRNIITDGINSLFNENKLMTLNKYCFIFKDLQEEVGNQG